VVEPGTVDDVVYLGMVTRIHVHLDGGDDVVVVQTNDASSTISPVVQSGERIQVSWRREDAFELESELV